MTQTRRELLLKSTQQQKNEHNYSTQPIDSGPFMMIHQKLQISLADNMQIFIQKEKKILCMLHNEGSAPLEPLGTSHGTTGSHENSLEITGLHYLTLNTINQSLHYKMLIPK
jgi:hypothetical protein